MFFKSKIHVDSAQALINFLIHIGGRYSDKSVICDCLKDIFAPLVSESASHLRNGSEGRERVFDAIFNLPFHFRGEIGSKLAAANDQQKQSFLSVKDRDLYHARRFAFCYFHCISLSLDPNTAAQKRFSGKPDPFHELAESYQQTLFELFRERHTDLLIS